MKNIFSLLLTFSPFLLQAQTYKTKIEKANKVEINGGTVVIIKTDTVFLPQKPEVLRNEDVQTIPQTPQITESGKTRIYLVAYSSIKDSVGIYNTKYTFAPQENNGFFAFNIVVHFDNAFLVTKNANRPFGRNISPSVHIEGSGMSNISTGQDSLNTTIGFKGTITSGDGVSLFVKSKEPLRASFYGVVGKLLN